LDPSEIKARKNLKPKLLSCGSEGVIRHPYFLVKIKQVQNEELREFKRRHLKASNFPGFQASCFAVAAGSQISAGRKTNAFAGSGRGVKLGRNHQGSINAVSDVCGRRRQRA
jgi:hypothetical protein